jgi:hypothetical protein
MTAKDTIATNVHAALCCEPNHEDCDGVDEVDERVAAAVIAAVRGMPVEDQAELIGGWSVVPGDTFPPGYSVVAVKR